MSARKIPKCATCAICKVRAAQVVHHILPRSLGGLDTECNLQDLCRECHARLHPFMQRVRGRREGIPFFSNELATYYQEGSHVYRKAKHLAQVIKDHAQNPFNAFLKKVGR